MTLPDTERAGVLTHPAWLQPTEMLENGPLSFTVENGFESNCSATRFRDVPITVDANLDPATKELSARERVAMATDEDPAYASRQMDESSRIPV